MWLGARSRFAARAAAAVCGSSGVGLLTAPSGLSAAPAAGEKKTIDIDDATAQKIVAAIERVCVRRGEDGSGSGIADVSGVDVRGADM